MVLVYIDVYSSDVFFSFFQWVRLILLMELFGFVVDVLMDLCF